MTGSLYLTLLLRLSIAAHNVTHGTHKRGKFEDVLINTLSNILHSLQDCHFFTYGASKGVLVPSANLFSCTHRNVEVNSRKLDSILKVFSHPLTPGNKTPTKLFE